MDDELQTFNREQLLTSCGMDEELASQVVMVFLTDIPKQLNDLELAIGGGEAKTTERVSHSIKGASATVGGDALRACAFECERAAHEGKLDEVSAKVPELRKLFDALRDELEEAGFVDE